MTPADYSETSVPDTTASHLRRPYSSAYQTRQISVGSVPSGTITTCIERRAVVFLETRMHVFLNSQRFHRFYVFPIVHSCQQKSIGLKFSKSQTGSDVRYSCHHNSSRFTFPIFAHSCRFSVLHSLQSITPRIY